MSEGDKTKEQFLDELEKLRRRVAALEVSAARRDRAREQVVVFQRFAEASGQGLGMAQLDKRITYVNPTLSHLIGERTPEEAVGKSLARYYPEVYQRKLEEEVIPTVMRKGQWVGEMALVTSAGRLTPTFENFFVIRDEMGNPVCLADVIVDISERKKAEEALRRSHDELRAIYDGMFDGLLVADVETKSLLRSNPAICRMLGYSKEELLAMSVLDIHPPDELRNVLEKFDAQAEGQLAVAESLPTLRKDGSVFYADVASTVVDYRGRRCNLGIFRDITQRRQAEEAVRQQQKVLRHMLASGDRERQLIAYEIHDALAQQLTAAKMRFQDFDRRRAENLDEALKPYQDGVQLLDEALIETRRLIDGLRPPILDEQGITAALEHLVRESRTEGRPEIEFHSDVSFDRLEPPVENSLYRMVQEGLMNAIKHSKSDRVRIELVQEGDRLRVILQDWGVGFEPASVAEGCFGIEGIKQRARLFSGRAEIESAPQRGTRLVVELPLTAAQ